MFVLLFASHTSHGRDQLGLLSKFPKPPQLDLAAQRVVAHGIGVVPSLRHVGQVSAESERCDACFGSKQLGPQDSGFRVYSHPNALALHQ